MTKAVRLIFSMSLAFTSILSGCDLFDQKEPKPKTELEKLPPATKAGKQTFGCLVNGMAWVPKTKIDALGVFQQGILQISGELISPFQSIGMVIHENGISIDVGEYSLTNYPNSYSQAAIELTETTGCVYEPQDTFSGTVTITRLDRVNYIVSGFFEFETVTADCETLKITDGRFDLHYIP